MVFCCCLLAETRDAGRSSCLCFDGDKLTRAVAGVNQQAGDTRAKNWMINDIIPRLGFSILKQKRLSSNLLMCKRKKRQTNQKQTYNEITIFGNTNATEEQEKIRYTAEPSRSTSEGSLDSLPFNDIFESQPLHARTTDYAASVSRATAPARPGLGLVVCVAATARECARSDEHAVRVQPCASD